MDSTDNDTDNNTDNNNDNDNNNDTDNDNNNDTDNDSDPTACLTRARADATRRADQGYEEPKKATGKGSRSPDLGRKR